MDTLLKQYVSEGRQDERLRLSRYLHDTMGGTVANVKLMLTHLKRQNDTVMLDRCIEQVSMLGNQLRSLSHELHSYIADKADFINKLNALAATIEISKAIAVTLEGVSMEVLPRRRETLNHLYMVIQQTLHNAITHASPSCVSVLMSRSGNSLQVQVSDNGIGTATIKGGIGLQHIADRIGLMGGTFRVDTVKGFMITINIITIDD